MAQVRKYFLWLGVGSNIKWSVDRVNDLKLAEIIARAKTQSGYPTSGNYKFITATGQDVYPGTIVTHQDIYMIQA